MGNDTITGGEEMGMYQRCELSFQLDGRTHHGVMRIDRSESDRDVLYRAVIETSALRGTYGGEADTVAEALDFLNLAMQAEGADEIVFTCPTEGGEQERAA